MKRFMVPRVAHCGDGCIRKGFRPKSEPHFILVLLLTK